MENSREYYCLNIMLNTSSFSPLNTNMNTNLKYYRKQALNKKLKLVGGAMKFFTKKLLGYEIFSSMIPWVTKYFLKNLLKPPTPTPHSHPSYILNVRAFLQLFWFSLFIAWTLSTNTKHQKMLSLIKTLISQKSCRNRLRILT